MKIKHRLMHVDGAVLMVGTEVILVDRVPIVTERGHETHLRVVTPDGRWWTVRPEDVSVVETR